MIIQSLVLLQEVPAGGDDSLVQTSLGESLEDRRTEVKVVFSATGARVDDGGVDFLAVGSVGDPDGLTAVAAVVHVVNL